MARDLLSYLTGTGVISHRFEAILTHTGMFSSFEEGDSEGLCRSIPSNLLVRISASSREQRRQWIFTQTGKNVRTIHAFRDV